MERKNTTSWFWVILWLIIFWPIGLFLFIKKLATDKSALMSGKASVISAIGWFLLIGGALGSLHFISDFSTMVNSEGMGSIISRIIFLLAIIVGGALLLRKASNAKKAAVKYKNYIDIVVNQNVRSIDSIASAVGLSYTVVSNELQKMINSGYLKDAYIHHGNRELVLVQPAISDDWIPGQTASQAKASRCPGCGAKNVVTVGRVSECAYCGTPITA